MMTNKISKYLRLTAWVYVLGPGKHGGEGGRGVFFFFLVENFSFDKKGKKNYFLYSDWNQCLQNEWDYSDDNFGKEIGERNFK